MNNELLDNNTLTDRKEMCGNIPVRILHKDDQNTASQNGCILFYHGLGASKDKQFKELEDLANNGFLAVGGDNVGHGDREFDDFEERFSEDNPDRVKNIICAVRETASEINFLVNWLIDTKLLINDKIGVVGISLGGFIAYAVPMFDDRPKTVVSILGSPQWEEVSESPGDRIEKYSKLSLLSLNAGMDMLVPPEQAKEFHIKLKKHYTDYEQRFKYIEYPDSGHFMEEEDWLECWEQCLNWFKSRL